MEILYGTAAHPGVAIAAAARLGDEFGTPTLAPERLRRLGERLRSFGIEQPEPEQIVLVAECVPPAFWLSPIPGLQVVGLAAQSPLPLAPVPSLPAVLGLGETLLRLIAEDDILIVDGDRGRVYVSPDAATVARYQAPLTLARRFFLEGAHLPARTASDDRPVAVLCAARTLGEAESAMRAGADGLVVPRDNDFLGADGLAQTAGEQAQALAGLARMIGGQPLFLDVPQERLALSALARGAAGLPLHLVLREPSERHELRTRMDAIEEALEDDDVLFGRVQLEAGLEAGGEGEDLPDSLDDCAGVFVTGSLYDAHWERLLRAAGQARGLALPVTAPLDGDWWPHVLGNALGMGFARVVAPAEAVADVKDAIREA